MWQTYTLRVYATNSGMDPNLCDVRTCGWAETTINFNVGPRSGRFVIEPTEGVALFTGMLTALIWMILCSLICWIAEHITNAYCELDLLRAILCGSVTLNTKWQHHLIRYSDSISNLPITFNLRRVNCLAVFYWIEFHIYQLLSIYVGLTVLQFSS